MAFFKDEKYYKLIDGTLEISGVRMHQTKNKTPLEDARDKIKLLAVWKDSNVLDVCTGLGYTAIECAEKGARVTTIERDENVLSIARENEASKKLFGNENIEIVLGNAFEEVKKFDDACFDFILHDPPRFSLAGEIYSLEFYKQLFRVLKKKGKLFHYVGSPGAKRGKSMAKGVKNRLQEAGFKEILWSEGCQGFTALKQA